MKSQPRVLAIVLAGGEGKRLYPLTADRAKPAVPFGGNYRLIDFVLSNLVNAGYMRIAVLTHALAAVAIILVFILHVYAAFWTRGTLRAMTRGTVTGGWAYRHHRKWLRELAGRRTRGPAE